MVALRYIPTLFAAMLLALLPSGSAQVPAAGSERSADSLFAQSAAELLNRDFTNPDLSFLLLDAKSGNVLASRWDDRDAPIPMGSLVKPFTALAYGERHDFHYPAHVCRGTASGCWSPRGHGDVTLTTAVAYSCNSYFQMLASALNAQEVSLTATDFGIEKPDASAGGRALGGIGTLWLISPMKMAHAYLELVSRRDQPGVREILDGMALSGRRGTGSAVDRALPFHDALVKTGTAPCTHAKRAPGDGFVITLWPKDESRVLLLLRVHGKPGSQVAETAGEMLRRIGE
jgi:hypothetical protein